MNRMSDPCFLLYSPCANGFLNRLIEMLDNSFSGFGLEVFFRREDIMERLRYPKLNIASAVLIAPSQTDLRDAEVLKSMLEDTPIIMVLPDGRSETVALAHRFRPRFLTYLDDDEERVIRVLRQIVWKKEPFRQDFVKKVPAEASDGWTSAFRKGES